MKYIYVVLIESYTGLGKLLKKVTGYRYEHIAVSMDKSLTEFVSYSRKQHHHPFKAGFMREYRDYYAFEEYKKFYAKIFALPVTLDRYRDIEKFIAKCENDPEQIFNLFAMLTTPVLHGLQIYKAHNCMDFTAKVIELAGVGLAKPYYKYSIPDIEELLSYLPHKEGYIRRMDSPDYDKYVEKSDIITGVKEFAHVIRTLTHRLIFDRKKLTDSEW